RPSWIFSDEEIAATRADYLALGHWDRPMCVGNGVVPAFYSGSPGLAGTVNLVRLTAGGEVVVTREPLACQEGPSLTAALPPQAERGRMLFPRPARAGRGSG